MQCSQVSRNVTQIEVAKIDDLKEDGIILKKSPYSRGFIQNWKDCLFPSKIEPCEPFEIEYNDKGEVLIPGFMMDNEELIPLREQVRKLEEEEERKQKEWQEKQKQLREENNSEAKEEGIEEENKQENNKKEEENEGKVENE